MRLGLDIGSTTIKCVVLDNDTIQYSSYQRHFSQIQEKVAQVLEEVQGLFPEETFQVAISGSAGMGLAEKGGLNFVQEVFATRIAANHFSPGTDVILELGGEDAKILFLTNGMEVRMNGTCAGGTGAFIDQMATLLHLTPEELNQKAKGKETIYTIASRCGVFAKSDIQPLLNQGAKVEDIAASIFYSVVNQTITGLAQGRPIKGKVLYLGGPLTFMDELREAFDKVLKGTGILPKNSLYYVALGAALYADRQQTPLSKILAAIQKGQEKNWFHHGTPLFTNKNEYETFSLRHEKAKVPEKALTGFSGRAHLGIDAGSTTCKTVLISEEGEILHKTYQANSGTPIPIVKEVFLQLYKEAPNMTLASVTTTGYGENLCKEAFRADTSIVETMAHFGAAKYFLPEVDFIIDIGGQDMKCFHIENGAISDIFLNEACSSGCGSFLQTFAQALDWDVEDFAKISLFAPHPVELGSRCTVFMNSSVKQAQKDGATIDNISAGLAISIVKNALYKVIRANSPEDLGKHVVVQGGTFLNDGVLRAFEQEMAMEVIRPSIAGLMGAFGAALYGRKKAKGRKQSEALKKEELINLTHQVQTTQCKLCTNHCKLTINHFTGGRRFISGNRCQRPVNKKTEESSLDIYSYKQALLAKYQPQKGKRGKIGIPMVLNLFEMLPFWHTLFTELGFEVITSPPSTRALYFKGQGTIPSDTVCYPAKLAHGHIKALTEMEGVDIIFYPCMTYNIDEKKGDNHFNCPVVAYYPEVIKASCSEIAEKTFIYDYVGIHKPKEFTKKFTDILKKHGLNISYKEVKNAVEKAYEAYEDYFATIRKQGKHIIEKARQEGKRIILLAGRPYHVDQEINHGIHQLITQNGAAVISEDCVSHLMEKKPVTVLNQWTYHARLYAAANYVATQEDMELVQLVSFGCGLDAVTTDEVREILHGQGKLYTQIKIDEIENLGAVNIRLRSLFSALDQKREEAGESESVL
ncbi:MAG: 2-hydroxyglutaryl-CoA dehydratase [Clostridiales bacterium]|nr:2-hydroxyglutaryl-CoA dehydratase [Clostridiales bacterium]